MEKITIFQYNLKILPYGGYNGNCIEKGNNSQTKDIRDYYNKLISLDLENMVITAAAEKSDLTQYDCEVKVSNTTRRVYQVIFTKK